MILTIQPLGPRRLDEARSSLAFRHSIQSGNYRTLALDLQFARDSAYVSRRGPLPTFTRASVATCVNSAGLIVSAAINAARIDYDPATLACRGLLLEEQRTNLCPRSEEFSDASWSKFNATVSANAGAAPDGATTADLVYPSSTGALTGQCYRAIASGISSGNVVTVSCFVKAAGKTFAYIAPIQNSFSPAAYFNLSTGAVTNVAGGVTASIQQFPNGWWRIVATSTAGAGPYYAVVGSTDAAGAGTNTVSGTNGILAWGMDVEVGSFATSYIPTTSAAVVRSADVCSITGAAFTGFYNQTEGAMVFKGIKQALQPAVSPSYLTVDDGTSANRIILFGGSAETTFVTTGGVLQASLGGVTQVAVNTAFGMAVRYKGNNFALSLNGGVVSADVSGTVPTVTQMLLGNRLGSSYMGGWIQSVQYYNRIKTNAQLKALSSP